MIKCQEIYSPQNKAFIAIIACMKTLLIATKNPGKIAEIAAWLTPLGIPFATLNDFPEVLDVEETGTTFEENAKLKAREYFEATGLPTLADDSGFEIDALGGKPGVYSKRWVYNGEKEATDEEIVNFTMEQMKDVPKEKRTARLRSVMVLFDGEDFVQEEDAIEGLVSEEKKPYQPGFPYRGLLYVLEFGKMYDELSEEEHRAVNQRIKVLEKLKPVLLQRFT